MRQRYLHRAMQLAEEVGGRGVQIHVDVRHDDGCPVLFHGPSVQCTCEPDVRIREIHGRPKN